MPPQPSLTIVKGLSALPRRELGDTSDIPNGNYTVQAGPNEKENQPLVEGEADKIKEELWFKTTVSLCPYIQQSINTTNNNTRH
jgi:hypothetical protein